jgi:hypothetical protein
MSTHTAEDAAKPIPVQIIEVEKAQKERRSIPMTYVPPVVGASSPVCILPLSNKRIHAIVSVTGVGVANLCTSQAQALQVTATYNAGAIIGPGTFELVGTGEFWLIASATGVLVSVIAEYES